MPHGNKIFDKFDMFGVDPPNLNLGGREKITSSVGFANSILVYVLMSAYSISKILDLVDGDPEIIEVSDADEAESAAPDEVGLAVAAVVPPVPDVPANFQRPPRKKTKVKRALLPQASAVNLPGVLCEQGGHEQQQSEMERVFLRYFGDLVSEWESVL